MTNGHLGPPLAMEILRAIAAEYRWPKRYHEIVVPVELAPAQLERFAGSYDLGAESPRDLLFTVSEGRLHAHAGPEPVPLWAESETDFIRIDNGTRFRFNLAGSAVESVVIKPATGSSILAPRVAGTSD